jgi:ADP-heptose:LPS heptosyltransferase
MIELPDVTIIIADTKNYGRAAYAIVKTLEQIKPAKTVWLTDIDYNHPDVDVVKINPINSKAEYSEILIKRLSHYFTTYHCLVIQHDGYVINGDQWKDEYLEYDYIGAPWLYPDTDRNVGNGGFSLRSHRLQTYMEYDSSIEIVEPEDEVIGRLYRRYLENKYGLSYAPEDIADTFSYELRTPICKTFGFHGYFHAPYQETIMITREGAGGDVISLEPVLHYYHKKGYRVVLNTLPQFFSLFANHYFKVHHPGELDDRLKYKEINLDLSYEAKPKQLHLKSYFEACGIPESEMELRAPKLNYAATEDIKLFKQKYVIFHIDRTETRNRDAETAWWKITDYLKKKGYLCVQIGKNEHVELDAIQLNTVAEPMLAYVIAGCSLFIGIDSGPSHIAVATGRKAILFFGSVNPKYIHPDLTNIRVITQHKPGLYVCSKPFCWHETSGTRGEDCILDKEQPPCISYDSNEVIDAINELL